MKQRLLTALLLALLPIAACSSESATPAPASAETAAAANAAPAQAPAAEAQAPVPVPAPVEGSDYVLIEPALPYAPQAGKIEVVEVFGYTCSHCAALQPELDEWKARQAADVSLHYLPGAFGGYWTPYARAFFTAETLGLADKTHAAMFRAIHIERVLPPSAEAGPQIAQWYGTQGTDADAFASTMDSFAINAKIERAKQLAQRWGVDGTPTMIVNGKYRVMVTDQGSEHMLRTVDWLVVHERAKQ